MSDDIDRVQDAQAIHIAAALTHFTGQIPAGVPGECDECGEIMPRLVGGRCGFCRDGRRPPLSFYEKPAPTVPVQPRLDAPVVVQAATAPAPGVAIPKEEDAMPDLPNRKITIEGLALGAVELRAVDNDISFKQAAAELIELGLRADAVADTDAPVQPTITADDMTGVSTDSLVGEVYRRLTEIEIQAAKSSADLLFAAIARAEAAETSLATIKQVLAEVRPQA